jgi:hypothetical protein
VSEQKSTRKGYLDDEGDEGLAAFCKENVDGRCASCEFWDPIDDPVLGDRLEMAIALGDPPVPFAVDYEGSCKRRAPVKMLCDIDPENCPGCASAVWPTTRWRDWCGEYSQGRLGMPCDPDPSMRGLKR